MGKRTYSNVRGLCKKYIAKFPDYGGAKLAKAVASTGEDSGYSYRYLKQAFEYFKKEDELAFESTEGVLKKILENYTPKELQAIANGGRVLPGIEKVPIVDFNGKRVRIGAICDTHIGSLYFKEDRLFQAFEEFRKKKVDFITHGGDVTEGMSNRPGHIYELSHIGYDRQKTAAINLLGQWTDTDMYMIDGNHDRWFIKSSGAYIVKDICNELPNAKFLGHDEGDISLNGKSTLKLWHGEDSSSYAVSYRIQKVVESLSGGTKPGAMFFAHVHKQGYFFERNIHCVSTGSIQEQTKWMRGKRISAHVGFHVIDIWVGESGINKFRVEFYPFYA